MLAVGGCHEIVIASSLTSLPVEITVGACAICAAGSSTESLRTRRAGPRRLRNELA